MGGVNVQGQGFTQESQVLIDGQPAPVTVYTNSSALVGQVSMSLTATVGTHQIAVQNGSQVSNSIPFTVYTPQQGPFVMQATPGFLVGENLTDPTFIVAADVNGDGMADLLMPGPGLNGGGSIAILNGQANGTLAAAQYVPIPQTSPDSLAVGDVDGNGTPDLVSITNLVGSSTITVSVSVGDGHGNFQSAVVQQTFPGLYPDSAQLADLNGDGKPDLLLAVRATGNGPVADDVVWLQNTGGAFAAPITLITSAANNPSLSVADFAGNGELDILYETSGTTTVAQSLHILMNQGNGSFTDQLAGGLNGIVGPATVVDFNLDGIPDLIVQVEQQNETGLLYAFQGVGNGSFTLVSTLSTPGLVPLVTGDFDNDGLPDLAGPSGLEPSEILYFFGDGHGNFTIQPVVGAEGSLVAVGDFNGDGIPDVVVPDEFNFVSLSLGRTGRGYPSPLALFPATMTELSTGDINGDGLPEIFVGGNYIYGIPGTVFLNQGNSSFQLAAKTDPSSFEIADLSSKPVFDLLGGNTNLEIWPNNGTLDFSSSPITFTQPTSTITVADMDGDGYPDIVSATGQVFYGNGNYQFTPVTLATSNWGPYVLGDFDGDGKLDIATASGTFLNTGNQTFQQVTGTALPLVNGVMTAVGDFNGDGKDDVAINLPGTEIIYIYYSMGDGTFYAATILDPGQSPGALSVGDFNGDGNLDLAVGLMLSQQVCMFFGNSNGQFSRSFFASGADVVAMTAADLNNNGQLDLVIGNFVLDFAPPNVNVVFHQ
jgi:hypothetical protein